MNYEILFNEVYRKAYCELSDEDCGRLFKAICGYIADGTEPSLPSEPQYGPLRLCWRLVKMAFETSATKSEAGAKGGQNANKAATRFVRPVVEDVRAYCAERNNSVDPEQFVDFYESKGWKVGNASMKDWKAAVRTWEKRSNQGPKQKSIKGTSIRIGYGEWVDGQGCRFYGSGRPVPLSAPPRPGKDFYWSKESNSWVAGV